MLCQPPTIFQELPLNRPAAATVRLSFVPRIINQTVDLKGDNRITADCSIPHYAEFNRSSLSEFSQNEIIPFFIGLAIASPEATTQIKMKK